MKRKSFLIFGFGFVIGVFFQRANEIDRGLLMPITLISFTLFGFFCGTYIQHLFYKITKLFDKGIMLRKKRHEKLKALVEQK